MLKACHNAEYVPGPVRLRPVFVWLRCADLCARGAGPATVVLAIIVLPV
jgi:hypothetical protein